MAVCVEVFDFWRDLAVFFFFRTEMMFKHVTLSSVTDTSSKLVFFCAFLGCFVGVYQLRRVPSHSPLYCHPFFTVTAIRQSRSCCCLG
jgi:hypothetical protein